MRIQIKSKLQNILSTGQPDFLTAYCIESKVCGVYLLLLLLLFLKITFAAVSPNQSEVVVLCSSSNEEIMSSWAKPAVMAASTQPGFLIATKSCVHSAFSTPKTPTPIPPFLCPKGCWLVTWFHLKNNLNANPFREEMARVLSWNVSNAG